MIIDIQKIRTFAFLLKFQEEIKYEAYRYY